MGAVLINGAVRSHHDYTVNIPVPLNFKLDALYDGQATLYKWSPNLPANEIWIDASALYREGVNLGVTIQNLGATGTVDVYGSMIDRGLVNKVRQASGAAIPAAVATSWVSLKAAMAAGTDLYVGMTIYSVFRLVFTSGTPGAVTLQCV